MRDDALKAATNLLKHVFDGDIPTLATLITAEAVQDKAPAIHGLECLVNFCQELLKELKDGI